MAVAKKSSAVIPPNMSDTLASLNSAATGTSINTFQQTPVYNQVPPVQPVQAQQIVPPAPQQAVYAAPKQAQIPVQPVQNASKPSTEKTMISLRLLKSDKEKFQEFFKAHGLSFTDGLYMAADFIEKEVASGRLQLSKSGIQYK